MKPCVVNPNHSFGQRAFVKGGAKIYICPECGCIMADIAFQHIQYESDSYYTMSHKAKEGIEYEWGFRWRYILNKIAQSGNFSSLLDVGAGNGYFVLLASSEFLFNATGLEISKEQIQFAKDVIGVHLLNEDVAQHIINYDIVTCFNVLEHVLDPQLFLANMVKRMKPGGILVLTTHNPGCIHVKIKGLKNWNMVDPPHHINIFTKKALDELIKKHHLIVSKYETLSTYIHFIRKFDTKNLILRRFFFNALRIFNLGADHFLIVKKISS